MDKIALAAAAHPDDIEFMMAGTMALLALHPNVQFNFLRPAVGTCQVEMH